MTFSHGRWLLEAGFGLARWHFHMLVEDSAIDSSTIVPESSIIVPTVQYHGVQYHSAKYHGGGFGFVQCYFHTVASKRQ